MKPFYWVLEKSFFSQCAFSVHILWYILFVPFVFSLSPRCTRSPLYEKLKTNSDDGLLNLIHCRSCTSSDDTRITTARWFMESFVFQYGILRRWITDQAVHFTDDLMKNSTRLPGTNHIHTAVYHSQGSGYRFNANLSDWDDFLSSILYAYNTDVHSSIEYTYSNSIDVWEKIDMVTRIEYIIFCEVQWLLENSYEVYEDISRHRFARDCRRTINSLGNILFAQKKETFKIKPFSNRSRLRYILDHLVK